MKRKLIVMLLTAALLMSLPLPALAEEENTDRPVRETIILETADDLFAFAHSCVLDSWSRDKQVVLKSDISLDNAQFMPIPTFGGIFDGGGHSITGLNITQSVTPAGLFGNLQSTAVVKNLTVQGTVTPGGDCAATGGITGENYGTMENCAFSGEIAGQMNTGGIAGSNLGVIRDCTAAGNITGHNRTGGIAGYNDGQITGCKNAMAVNTESVDPTLDPMKIELGFTLDFSKISRLDVSNAASDSGGIVGYSSGSITDCMNSGNVGYPHIGYNLGGIVGRSCGFVESCENQGGIYGRKDVGGVAGQIEPHIQTILSPDYLETLSKQFESLGGLVSRAGSNGTRTGGNVQDSIQIISGYRSAAQTAIGTLVSSAVGGEMNIEALNDLGSAVQGMVSASDGLKGAIGEGVETLSSDISAISGQIGSISRTFALATEDARQEIITDLSDVDLSDITEGRVLNCVNTGAVEADLNVGGIAGVMGLESTVDPEDDAPSGGLTQRRRYELKVIVDSCENAGNVIGKRSYAGGICGRMELGLITQSRGYGRITSQNGDYVGGIAGLAGGTVRDCFAKCTLSGRSYIGGIVGSGIALDYRGDSSTVTGCYSMVDIAESEQYIGAISGVNTGVFTENYFVSDTLAGINQVSYAALAEPVTYEEMQKLQSLPQSLRELTLRFTADGQTVKTLLFHYGDSFDESVYPEIPQKDGFYARWSTRDLENLHFDTVVEANYFPYITALNSTDARPGEHPVFFVQGQFREGDVLTVTPGKKEFVPAENQTLVERWHLSIPADGLESHTIRYLPGQEGLQVYLLKSGSWSRIQPEDMGTYLAFDAAGAEVELAIVSASYSGRYLALALVGAFTVVLLFGVFCPLKRKKAKKGQPQKKKKRWIFLLIGLLAADIVIAAWAYIPRAEIAQTIRIYDILKAYLEQPEQETKLTVKAQIENQDANFVADIGVTKIGDHRVSVITENGRSLYYSEGVVFVENGDAFRPNIAAPDYSQIVRQLLELSRLVRVDSTDGKYSMTVEGTQAVKIMGLLMPSVQSFLPEPIRLTVEIMTDRDALTQIRFTGAGNLTDSVKTPFSVSAVVDVLPTDGVTVPRPVAQSILSGQYSPQEIYSDELIQLIGAWATLRERNPIAAQITMKADCGPLTIDDSFHYSRWKTENTVIHGMDKTGQMLYFGSGKVCNSDGRKIYVHAEDGLDVSMLTDILYKAFQKAQFECRQEDSGSVYTVTLQPDGMKELGETILPKTKSMDISYDKGSIRLSVQDGQFQSVHIACGGSTKASALSADVQLELDIVLEDDAVKPTLPDAVKSALVK